MSIFAEIIGGGLGKLIKDVVGTFKLAPEDKLKFEAIIEEHAHEIQMKEYELQVRAMEAENKALETASANIKAELATGDKVVTRARPLFLYIIYLVLVFNYIAIPIVQLTKGVTLQPIVLPADLIGLFAAGYLGYTYYRSKDKNIDLQPPWRTGGNNK